MKGCIFSKFGKLTNLSTEFIRGLLQNVGAEIDPIRLIKRIRNGLEIPGLKLALIKILQDFNLQVVFISFPCHPTNIDFG